MLSKVSDHIIEISWVVVNDGPTTAPSREAVDLWNGSSANHGHGFCYVPERDERSFGIITEPVIYFIWDYWEFEFLSHLQDFVHVFSCKTRTTWVWWIVDQDCLCIRFDLSPEVVKVDFPSFVWVQSVSVILNSNVLANWLTQWKTWAWHKDTVTNFAKDWHGVIKSARAAKAQKDMVWIDRVFIIAKFIRNSFASDSGAWCLCITIVLLGVHCLNYSFVYALGELKTIGSIWLTETKINHTEFVILGRLHLPFEDLPDGVVNVRSFRGSMLSPCVVSFCSVHCLIVSLR